MLAYFNEQPIAPQSVEECLEQCRNNVECRTVEYDDTSSVCYIKNITKLDAPASDWHTGISGLSHYQKMCAWDGHQLCLPLHSSNASTSHRSPPVSANILCPDLLAIHLHNCTHVTQTDVRMRWTSALRPCTLHPRLTHPPLSTGVCYNALTF